MTQKRRLPGTQREVTLPGGGQTRVVEVPGPEGAPTLILAHGLAATGPLNWHSCLAELAEHYNVIALDHRGHGRGARTRRFRLEQCADDIVGVADALGIDSFIVVGYSMGGPISKLTWKRHPKRVRGLVLCATAGHFRHPSGSLLTEILLPGAAVGARLARGFMMERIIQSMIQDIRDPKGRAFVRAEMWPSDPVSLIQATRAVTRFSSREWAADISVPTAVLITKKDKIVPPHRQYALASAIEGAIKFEIEGDHFACATAVEQFVPAIVEACQQVDAAAA